MTELTEEKLTEFLDRYDRAQKALVARLEARIEQQEQLISALTSGYVEVAAIVNALVEHSVKDDEKFSEALAQYKKMVFETLQTGASHAEDKIGKFVSHSSRLDGSEH